MFWRDNMEVSNTKTANCSKQYLTIEIVFFIHLLANPGYLFLWHIALYYFHKWRWLLDFFLLFKKKHCFSLLVSHVLLPVICCSVMLLMFQSSRNCKCYFFSWIFHDLKLLNSSPVEYYLNSAMFCLWGTQLNSSFLHSKNYSLQ